MHPTHCGRAAALGLWLALSAVVVPGCNDSKSPTPPTPAPKKPAAAAGAPAPVTPVAAPAPATNPCAAASILGSTATPVVGNGLSTTAGLGGGTGAAVGLGSGTILGATANGLGTNPVAAATIASATNCLTTSPSALPTSSGSDPASMLSSGLGAIGPLLSLIPGMGAGSTGGNVLSALTTAIPSIANLISGSGGATGGGALSGTNPLGSVAAQPAAPVTPLQQITPSPTK